MLDKKQIFPLVTQLFLLLISSMVVMTPSSSHAWQDTQVVANGFRGSMPNPPTLVERARFGMEGSEDALLIKPAHLLFTPDGNWVIVTDAGSKSLHVYDREGNFLYRIGREGAGPGELLLPIGAYYTNSGHIAVPDLMNSRTNFYQFDGSFLHSTPMPATDLRADIPLLLRQGEYLRRAGPTMLDVDAARSNRGDQNKLPLFEVINEQDKVIRNIGERKQGENLLIADHLNRYSVAVSGDKIAVAYRVSADIRIYNAVTGQLEQIITRRTAFRVREPAIPNEEMGFPVRLDVVSLSATFDDQGRLWVLTRLVSNDELSNRGLVGDTSNLVRLEVYDKAGRLLTGIPLEEPTSLIYFGPMGDLWLLDYSFKAQVCRMEVLWP